MNPCGAEALQGSGAAVRVPGKRGRPPLPEQVVLGTCATTKAATGSCSIPISIRVPGGGGDGEGVRETAPSPDPSASPRFLGRTT